MESSTIERVGRISRREFETRFVEPRIPVILTGCLDQSKALARWSFDFFRKKHGETIVPVHFDDSSTARLSLSMYLDLIEKDRCRGYCSSFNLFDVIPGLVGDLSLPPYTSAWRRFRTEPTGKGFTHWIGPAGTVSKIHVDHGHNLFLQITGRKRWELWKPSPRFSLRSDKWYGSAIDVKGKLPRSFAEFDLHASEMLFLPVDVPHQVTTLEPSIAVNHWFWTADVAATYRPQQVREAREARAARRRGATADPREAHRANDVSLISTELREFLALLVNVPEPAAILRLATLHAPERDPLQVAEEWLRTLASFELFDGWSESSVEPFRQYFQGQPVAEILKRCPSAREVFRTVRLAS